MVVLVRPRNPLNIGAAARAMSNFGVRHLHLVNPYAVGFREARSAVGASALLKNAREFNSVAEAVADCSLVVGTTAVRDRALQHPLRRLNDESAGAIRAALRSGRVGLLFGSEKIGLTNQDFTHCHWLLTIPTHARHSLESTECLSRFDERRESSFQWSAAPCLRLCGRLLPRVPRIPSRRCFQPAVSDRRA